MSAESHEADQLSSGNDEIAIPADNEDSSEADWEGDELEIAYRQALQAVEAVEHEVELQGVLDVRPSDEDSSATTPHAADEDDSPHAAQPAGNAIEPSDLSGQLGVTPRQIIEAALFVGGTPLTTKRLVALLRNEFDLDFVEQTIAELNAQYAGEQRPYAIVFGEGGYRLSLHSEFEKLRDRAYGFGPKEVKLSQDALEVLALVAYSQPVSSEQIEEAGKRKPSGILRQLVRRQLIAIERGEEPRAVVNYRTTPRFLELFGLKDLDELPQSDGDLNYK